MKIQLINITTYRGISSDADHFYATVADQNKVEESINDFESDRLESLAEYCKGEELRFMPNREEAIAFCKKDNRMSWIPGVTDHPRTVTEEQIWEMQYKGTIRFPSIKALVKQARQNYPEDILFFTLFGKRKEFLRHIMKDNNIDPEIKELLISKKTKK